jgi:chaperonin GroEL
VFGTLLSLARTGRRINGRRVGVVYAPKEPAATGNRRAAVQDGIVPGGGVALIRAKQAISTLQGANADQQAGINIVARAMEEPLRCIVSNAGESADVVLNAVELGTGNYGYNAATEQYCDMMEAGVIDPTKVAKTALINASSVAGLLLTTDCAIFDLPKDPSNPQPNMPNMM